MRVLITHYFPAARLDPLRAISPRLLIEHVPDQDGANLADAWARAEVLYTTRTVPLPEQAPRLRWVQGHFAGVEHIHEHPIARQVMLTTVSGIHAPAIGEYVLATMLAFAHRVPNMFYYKARSEWPQGRWDRFVPTELRDATVGIIGYGSLGREIGRLAQAFGMRVLAVKRRPNVRGDAGWRLPNTGDPDGSIPARVVAPAQLMSMLPECDYVVLAAPLTSATRHMFGRAELAALKPGALFINIARGSLVDEAALIDALQAGKLGGAVLDVFETEPLPPDSPLWAFDNVIISPHVAGFTPEYDTRALAVFAENLRRYLAGRPLLNQVDPEYGY